MINKLDYTYVITDKKMKDSGLFKGDIVLVTGVKAVPASPKDPYLQRVLVHVIKVDKDGHHHIPREDNDNRIYLVDPRNLEKVNENTQKELEDALRRQYGQE